MKKNSLQNIRPLQVSSKILNLEKLRVLQQNNRRIKTLIFRQLTDSNMDTPQLVCLNHFNKDALGRPVYCVTVQFQWNLSFWAFHDSKPFQHVDHLHLGLHDGKSHSYTVSGASTKRQVGHGVTRTFSLLGESKKN